MNDKQLAANRQNAKKSTGPKTPTGKALVALNSVAHGIYSVSPVIEELESKRAWTLYRQAMLASLAPVGMLEAALAERVILNYWRLRRVVRYETEQIRSDQESAGEQVGGEHGYDVDEDGNEIREERNMQEILEQAEWWERSWQRTSIFLDASDDTPQTENEAQELVWLALDELGQADSFEGYWKQFPAGKAWTIGSIRQLVRGLTDHYKKPFDEFLRTLGQHVAEEAEESSKRATRARARVNEYRREHLLPGTETLEKIQRYESHLSRQFHRDLHELQRLQSVRLGHPVAAPIAIDVEVSTESKAVTETAG